MSTLRECLIGFCVGYTITSLSLLFFIGLGRRARR